MNSQAVPYKKRVGLLRNPAIRQEIASLDAETDCQRIVHLLSCYEFPFDITRSLELALFHTYGSTRISSLLDRTGEFRRLGQKRYDDTRLLISHFLEEGYDSGPGRRAIERMNATHGHFRIANDDHLFVLSTFISFPIDWMEKYGYRPFTAHESQAWFNFFCKVGERMGIRDIPRDPAAFRQWVERYEVQYLVYAECNRNVANATLRVFESWFPFPLRRWVQPAVSVLISERLRTAFGFEAPAHSFSRLLHAVLRLRRRFMKHVNLERHPKLIANTLNRTYPGNGYSIEEIAPSYLRETPGCPPRR